MTCPDGWGNIPRVTVALVSLAWFKSCPGGTVILMEREAPDTEVLILYLTSHGDIMDAGMESSNPVRLTNPLGLVVMALR